MSPVLLLSLALAGSGVEVVEEGGPARVFVPAFTASAGATPDEAGALTDAVLEASRRLVTGLTFVGEAELADALDLEAQKQVAGCESDLSCLSEIADALDAPELLSGSLSRLGETWILDLKRVDRGGVRVKAQVQLRASGAVDALLREIDGGVRELFPTSAPEEDVEAAGFGALPWITIGVGVAIAAAGGVVFAFAIDNAAHAKNNLTDQPRAHAEAEALGTVLETSSYSAWTAGALLTVGGATLLFLE